MPQEFRTKPSRRIWIPFVFPRNPIEANRTPDEFRAIEHDTLANSICVLHDRMIEGFAGVAETNPSALSRFNPILRAMSTYYEGINEEIEKIKKSA